MKKILVLGGTGFLGTNLCTYLLNYDYDVVSYSRKLHSPVCQFPEISYVQGDFLQEVNFARLIDGVDIIFHLISTTQPANQNMSKEFKSNVIPTVNLLDACIGRRIKIIFFSSGGTVYGIPRYTPIDESHRTNPISPYGIHKLTLEKCLEYYGYMYGIDYMILRISNPYGAYQDPNGKQGAIAVFLSKAIMNRTIEIWGDGSVVRDYIYVDDVMKACISLLNYHGGKRIFNISSGTGYSINKVLGFIEQKINHPLSVQYIRGRKQDVPVNVLDNRLLEKECNWRCDVNLEMGIDKMMQLWNSKINAFVEE